MGGDALAVVKYLDRAGSEPNPHRLAEQAVRRRVVVAVDLDMVVEPTVHCFHSE